MTFPYTAVKKKAGAFRFLCRIAACLAAAAAAALSASCAASSAPFTVTGSIPSRGDLRVSCDTEISVCFNRLPEKTRTAEAVSLSCGGTAVAGRPSWDGPRLSFVPCRKLQANREFLLLVDRTAEDEFGRSLQQEFRLSFRTGADGEPPRISVVEPENAAVCVNPRQPITIRFEGKIDRASLLTGFALKPDVRGRREFSPDDRGMTFTPEEDLTPGIRYEFSLDENVRSAEGFRLGGKKRWYFISGEDTEPPTLSAVSASGNGSLTDGKDGAVNGGWEKDEGVILRFSERVNRKSAESSVTLEPHSKTVFSWNNAETELTVSPDPPLQWSKLYKLTINTNLKDLSNNSLKQERCYYLKINGERSKPPAVVSAEIICDNSRSMIYSKSAPATAVRNCRFSNTAEGDAQAELLIVDFHFETAAGAALPFFSVADNFKISAENGCLIINYEDFRIFNSQEEMQNEPEPKPLGGQGDAAARLICRITDRKAYSGMVEFELQSSLTDSLGNRMIENWKTGVFDEDN